MLCLAGACSNDAAGPAAATADADAKIATADTSLDPGAGSDESGEPSDANAESVSQSDAVGDDQATALETDAQWDATVPDAVAAEDADVCCDSEVAQAADALDAGPDFDQTALTDATDLAKDLAGISDATPPCELGCADAAELPTATDVTPVVDGPAPDATTDEQTGQPVDAAAIGKPVMPVLLPEAPIVDVTQNFGVDADKVHGPCVAVADFDGNGREDFAVIELSGTKARIHTVLLSDGAAQHVFTDVDTTVFVPNFGCSAVDMTADGKPDLLMGGYSGAGFYTGDGKGGFKDATVSWMPFVNDSNTFSILPVDLDGDLDLDVFIGAGFSPPPCETLKCQWTATDLLCTIDPPLKLTPQLQDRVLIQGASLPLVDATQEWNVPPGGTQTVVLPYDVDADGKMDLLVGDDFGTHRLLHNIGGTFKSWEKKEDVGFHTYAGAMGWTVGDLDGDGAVEFVLAESGPTPVYEMVAKKPGSPLTVEDRGGELGVWWPTWGASAWTPIVADLDHDGLDDLYLGISANFTAEMAADFINLCEASKQGVMSNPFKDVTSLDVVFTHGPGGGLVAQKLPAGKYTHVVIIDQKAIDLDADGDLDLVQTRPGPSMQPTSRVRILRNDFEKQGGFAVVVVKGKAKNPDAVGAVVRAKVNGKLRTRWLGGAASFHGLPTRRAHFGLGSADKLTDVEVTWPDGSKTAVGTVAAGAVKQVVQP